MYHSPVPLMVIRSDTEALIEVNGRMIGECSSSAYVATPVSDTGDYYICAIPLSRRERHYPVTRKLSFDDGELCAPPSPDVSICAWPGGVYELCIPTGCFDNDDLMQYPHEIDSMTFGKRSAMLYYENGLRLYVEENGAALCNYSLGSGSTGELIALELPERSFPVCRAVLEKRERLLVFDDEFKTVLDVFADRVGVCDTFPAAINEMDTVMRHELRTRYEFKNGAFMPLPAESGFFTHERCEPFDRLSLSIAFCEAVREGFEAEALGFLSPSLRNELTFEDITGFFGRYTAIRPPLSDVSGRFLGLIDSDGARISSARLFEFEFDGDKINNIGEA